MSEEPMVPPRVQDRSIVQRFNPLGKLDFPIQYLGRSQALLVEDEFYWSDLRSEAWLFDSHREAEAVAKKRCFIDAKGDEHEALAIVVGSVLMEEERRRREQMRIEFARKAALDLQQLSVAADEVYRATARRLGEHD